MCKEKLFLEEGRQREFSEIGLDDENKDMNNSIYLEAGKIAYYMTEYRKQDLKNLDKLKITQMISNVEKELNDESIDDSRKYLINQKLDTLKSFLLN